MKINQFKKMALCLSLCAIAACAAPAPEVIQLARFVPLADSSDAKDSVIRGAVLGYFRSTFISSPSFVRTFGKKTWDEIGSQVVRSLKVTEIESDFAAGRIWGLHFEVKGSFGSKKPRVTSVMIEID